MTLRFQFRTQIISSPAVFRCRHRLGQRIPCRGSRMRTHFPPRAVPVVDHCFPIWLSAHIKENMRPWLDPSRVAAPWLFYQC